MTKDTKRTVVFLVVGLIAMLGIAILSVFRGSTDISWQTVLQSLFNGDWNNPAHIAVLELRLPRTIGDLFIGASLACAGAIMQGMTRNPLADSGILGINAGAALGLALCLAFLPGIPFGLTILISFLGASFAALFVFGFLQMKRRKPDTSRLVLAGLAISMFLSAITQGLSIMTRTGQNLTFWSAGSTAAIRMNQLYVAIPVFIIALIGALLLSRQVSLLSLGDETAQALGLNLTRTKLLCLLVVLLLAGTSVALAGPIGFVGLLVPHIVGSFVSKRYEVIIPCSMVAGAIFMVAADLAARTINAPGETPIGFLFALVGVPMFIYIAKKKGGFND
ncbi:MAG: FecCD family ABC transporter permease [Allobaculum sp.]